MTQDQNMTDKGAPNAGNEPEENHDDAAVTTLLACDRQEILKECAALIVYISRHGDVLPDNEISNEAPDQAQDGLNQVEPNPDGTDTGQTNGGNTDGANKDIKKAYGTLIKGMMKCNSPQATSEDWQTLVMAYTQVTRFTYAQEGVNGRSVLDTLGGNMRIFQTESKKHKRWWQLRLPRWLSCLFKRQNRPLLYGGILLIAAFALQLLIGWAGRVTDPNTLTSFCKFLYYCVTDTAHLLMPALWGAIGACVYLMKRISDKLGKLAYEQSRQQGNEARILLGAVLAVVTVEIIFSTQSQSMAADDANLGPMALAFVVGLSIKPIYAAFETLVEGMAQRFQTKK